MSYDALSVNSGSSLSLMAHARAHYVPVLVVRNRRIAVIGDVTFRTMEGACYEADAYKERHELPEYVKARLALLAEVGDLPVIQPGERISDELIA
jgi:hypothetical protein